MSQNRNGRSYMDFGNVVLEHRPVVICQCKYDLCLTCTGDKDSPVHDTPTDGLTEGEEDILPHHSFYQRMKIYGPRVVIHQDSHMGTCNDCGRLYKVEINEIPITPSVNDKGPLTVDMTPREYSDHIGIY